MNKAYSFFTSGVFVRRFSKDLNLLIDMYLEFPSVNGSVMNGIFSINGPSELRCTVLLNYSSQTFSLNVIGCLIEVGSSIS